MLQQEKLVKTLRARGVYFRLLEHDPALSIAELERELNIRQDQMVKVLIFEDKRSGRFIVAALPGNLHVRWAKLAWVVEAPRSNLSLVSPGEIKRLTGFELGGIPPFGYGRNFLVVFDRNLLTSKTVFCSAGIPTRSMEIDSKALLQLSGGKVAAFCNEWGREGD